MLRASQAVRTEPQRNADFTTLELDQMMDRYATSASLSDYLQRAPWFGMEMYDAFPRLIARVKDQAAELARLLQVEAHCQTKHRTIALARPVMTYRGACGHLWDRTVEDTDTCRRCAVEAEAMRMLRAFGSSTKDAYPETAAAVARAQKEVDA